MSAIWMMRSWAGTPHGTMTSPRRWPRPRAPFFSEWGPQENPDERSFYACSPHRIEMAAHLIRDGYFADYANPALQLLPEWTQWCIEQSGLQRRRRHPVPRSGPLRGFSAR